MRMWMVDPQHLCKNHLLGEHSELHKHKWTFERKFKKDKYILNNCIEPMSMQSRHDELVAEMKARGYNHESPFEAPDVSYLPEIQRSYKVNREAATEDLLNRCAACKQRILGGTSGGY